MLFKDLSVNMDTQHLCLHSCISFTAFAVSHCAQIFRSKLHMIYYYCRSFRISLDCYWLQLRSPMRWIGDIWGFPIGWIRIENYSTHQEDTKLFWRDLCPPVGENCFMEKGKLHTYVAGKVSRSLALSVRLNLERHL